MTDQEPNAWWNTLRHEGVLVSPIVLDDWLPDGPLLIEDRAVDKLRQAYYRFHDNPQHLRPFLDALLEEFLGHSKPNWRKEQDIPDRYKSQGKKPNRVLLNAGKEHQARFVVLIDDEHVADEAGKPRRLGVHSGRRKHADLLRLMRATDVKLGILTNGHHVRLVYGGMDHESWAEWSCEAWFQGGDGRLALHGFHTLLGVKTLPPDTDSDANKLLEKVQESRDKQADLSHVMGTQIREAVEVLIEELTDTLASRSDAATILAPLRKLKRSKDEELQALYQGAIRCIMRLVVQLYAESRRLLPADPRTERLYYQSYSIEGLYQLLKRAASDGREEELRSLRSAWPRLLASWRAIHDGSIHKDLQIQSYGGQLFRPYAQNPDDSVLAAIHVLEDPRVHVSDWAIWEVLEKLRVGKYKVGRGKWRKGPVDFSDLRTEYIGMMYEGLLDYDLREARQEDGGIVFLAIGDQPALPLNVLEHQKDDDIKRLLKEQGKKNKGAATDAETETQEDQDDEAADDEAADDEADAGSAEDEEPAEEQTAEEQFQARVKKWAVKAVELGGLFGCTPARLKKLGDPLLIKKELDAASHKLVLKAIPPGGMYLVRWSGTRKGSGTFYTKPGLAVPTTVRTLEPLAYDNHEDREHRIVKRPEELLALKACDPAMGSGSFLVAALRFLAAALKESFEKYVIPKVESGEMLATETGESAVGLLTERILRTRHEDHSGERMESALKRAVVEHCIYGVDLNPLAVELGKLSLWIETMDPTLRFTFLDHKIKCGNGLVGTWKQQVEHYPLAAWDREAGDGKSSPRTALVKRIRKEIVLPELKTYLDGFKLEGFVKPKAAKLQPAAGQQVLLGGPAQASLKSATVTEVRAVRVATQTRMDVPDRGASWEEVLAHEMATLERIHANPNPSEQESEYEALLRSDGRAHQKYLLDKWCAVWFWPVKANDATTDVLGPREFYAERRAPAVHETVKALAAKHRFFHWELEYPEVFTATRFGFDCIVGNPPWETNEAKTQELFLKFDPAFRTLAGQQAKARIRELVTNPAVEAEYLDYTESFLASKHYFSNCHDFTQGLPAKQEDKWLAVTTGSKALPNGEPTSFARTRGKQNLYVLFAERALSVTKKGAMIGLIAPSGLFADTNTRDLREAWLEQNTWEWIYCFENRRKVFPIHAQFKFAAYIVRRGGRTERLRCRFMEQDVATWSAPSPRHVSVTPADVAELSPKNHAIIEVQDERDLALIRRLGKAGQRLADTGLVYVQGDFNMTLDAKYFHDRAALEAKGFRAAGNGEWISASGEIAWPLYEGRMVGILQFVKSGYVSGRGRSAKWRDIPPTESAVEPQYLVMDSDCKAVASFASVGVSFMDVTSATNTRTMVSSLSPPWPHNHKVPKLITDEPRKALKAAACLGSYAFDFVARCMTNSTSLTWTALQDMPIIWVGDAAVDLVRKAQAGQAILAPAWAKLESTGAPHEHMALREEVDATVAKDWGLSHDDMRWILRPDNPDPRTLWKDYRERLKILEAAGQHGKWYSLAEAREIRKKAGMGVDF